jgi:hypothetical protein
VTFYLSNTQVRPVGYEGGEFIDVDPEPSGLQGGALLAEVHQRRVAPEDGRAHPG